MTHRFFVPQAWIGGDRARLEGDVARQLGRVLRMSPGDEIILLDNSGKEFRVRLTSFSEATVEGDVLTVCQGLGESSVKVTLYQGMLKGEKFQWVLQKGTELGISAFVPLVCGRSISRPRESWPSSRYPRWNRIMTEAAEQSGRCLLPRLLPPMAFQEACKGVEGSSHTSIIPWEREGNVGLRSVVGRLGSDGEPSVNIFIGPEGGFEDDEVSFARSCGVVPVSLGRRILRSETASIVTLAVVMYAFGALGG